MRLLLSALIVILAPACATDPGLAGPPSKWAAANPDWIKEINPFRIGGDVYFVGARGLSNFLIATSEGRFLIDGGLPENAATAMPLSIQTVLRRS